MPRCFILLLFFAAPASAQFIAVQDVTLSSVSSGDEVTRWISNEYPVTDDPYPENYVYADGGLGNSWQDSDIPDGYEGVWLVHTNTTDADTVNASLVGFTISERAQVCVIWPDSVAEKAWIASGSYLDSGLDATLPGAEIASLYCAMKDAGALTFGDSGDPMYLVSVSPAWRAQPTVLTPPPDEEGFVAFSDAAYEIPENATTGDVVKFRRIISSVGAVSADVDDSTNTTCSTVDFDFAIMPTTPTATTPVTGSWGDAELGNIFLNIAMADLSADCIIEFEFENLTGGLQAYTERQTATVTILDADIPPSAASRFIEIGGTGDDLNSCLSGSPCLTPERAFSVAAPGDTIEMQVFGTGTGTYDQCITLTTAMSGTAGNVTTLQVRSGDTVNFYPASNCERLFSIQADYVAMDWTVGTAVIGDVSEWTDASNGRDYRHGVGMYITGDNVTWEGGTIYGGGNSLCNWVSGEHVTIDGATFDYCGTNDDTVFLPTLNDRGDSIYVRGAGSFKFINNTINHGGHVPGNFQVAPAVFRGNTFNSDWTDTPTGHPGQKGPQMCAGCAGDNATAPYGPIVWEENIVKNVAWSADQTSQQATAGIIGWQAINRRNLTCEASGKAGDKMRLSANVFTVSDSQGEMYFYNNTRVNAEGLIVTSQSSASNYVGMTGMDNNFIAGTIVQDAPGQTNPRAVDWVTNNFPLQGYENYWRDTLFRKNWIDSAELDVRLIGDGDSPCTIGTDCDTTYPNNFEDNATTSVTFAGYIDDNDCNFTDLAISGNGVGDAPHIAEITAGSSGTTLTMDRARAFWDGEGIAGEVADYIAIYDSGGLSGSQKGIRQIVSVDSTTQLTIDSSITVVSGDKVYLVLTDGTTVVDNMGAVQ